MQKVEPIQSGDLDGRSDGAGARMREVLQTFIRRAALRQLKLQAIPAGYQGISRGAGHFHLGAELFLQMGGETEFRFPHTRLVLPEWHALVMPPKLLHDERVRDGQIAEFSNLVIYADSQIVTCHLAYQESPRKPGIWHLEQCRHVDAARIQGWLADAALPPDIDFPGTWPDQQRALVLAVLTAVRRLLDAPTVAESREPALMAKLRVLIQNRLGDATLTVCSLAESLGCSADYLSHLYSQRTGEHLRAFIQTQRLRRAAQLLTEGDSAIKVVAWCCGFGSPSYFIRTFRKEFGFTPQSYRLRFRR
jgi:AraC-like DNA-binding protein